MGRLFYLRPPRDQLLRITRWRRECAGLMGRLTVPMHQESPRSASIWARTRIFPNSKHGKIFFLAIKIGKLLIVPKSSEGALSTTQGHIKISSFFFKGVLKKTIGISSKKSLKVFRPRRSLGRLVPPYHCASLRSASGNSRRPNIRGSRWVIPARGFLKCF